MWETSSKTRDPGRSAEGARTRRVGTIAGGVTASLRQHERARRFDPAPWPTSQLLTLWAVTRADRLRGP
jgi:hypothetical protein